MLLKIEIALAILAILVMPFAGPRSRFGSIRDALSMVCLGAVVCTVFLDIELNWIARTNHAISQTIELINRGRAEYAQAIWLDDVVSGLSQIKVRLPVEFASVLLVGGAIGFRMGKSQSNKAAHPTASAPAVSRA